METVIDQRAQGETAEDQERQGEAGRGWGDAWHCSLLSAVALAVTHWSHKCYIYQAAV